MSVKLYIGNKNYSSWSLRPWLLLKAFNIQFEEQNIRLFSDDYKRSLVAINPAGTVPYLIDGNIEISDSLAISEYINEHYLQGKGWPSDVAARASARAVVAEMHSSFFAIRNQMPMNCRGKDRHITMDQTLQNEVQRIDHMWSVLRTQYATQGPWLFGQFSIADCFYAPMALRFATYGITLSAESKRYQDKLLQHPDIQQWVLTAQQEPEVISAAEVGVEKSN